MTKPNVFIKRPVTYKAIELNLDNWKAISEMVEAGKLSDGKPEGCYIDLNGKDVDLHTLPEGVLPMIGLRLPTPKGVVVATEGQIIMKNLTSDEILVFEKEDLIHSYQSYHEIEGCDEWS